jgi:hypothetical protein
MGDRPGPTTVPIAGVPPGFVGHVLSVLRTAPGPMRRREILAELERRGHRISLAGLNRTLEECERLGLTSSDSSGVRPTPSDR